MALGYRTMDGIDLNDIWYGGAGISAAIDLYREVELPLIRALSVPWPETIMKYGIGERNGFQILGPSERPDRKIVTIATAYPTVAKYGYGVGTDLDTLQRSTGREVMMDMNRPMKEDPENVLTRYLQVMIVDPGTNNARYGFYNGQFAPEERITAPPKYQQQTFLASHTHYLTSITAGTIVLQDLTAMKQTIRHHGNMGPLIGFINSDTVRILENMAVFTQTSIIRSPISDQVSTLGFGETFVLLGITFHVSEIVPANYLVIVEGSDPDQASDLPGPIIMFEPAQMRGLRLHPGPMNDYPLIESFWDRWFGLKVFQRGAGAVLDFAPAHGGVFTSPTLLFS